MINWDALFSDGTETFCSPMEADPGEPVTLRIRTSAGDAGEVFLQHEEELLPMSRERSENGFDYYGITVVLGEEPYRYRFLIRGGEDWCWYSRTCISRDAEEGLPFCVFPGFRTPGWAKGAVMYQIFTDRFCNGDPSNDVLTGEYFYNHGPVRRVEDWDRLPDPKMDVGNFYGGDLQGVLDKMDYLQELGVEVIYFDPLFVSPSNHKYDTQDHEHIDPYFGRIVYDAGTLLPEGCEDDRLAARFIRRVTDERNLEASNEMFVRVVEAAHARGIRVILDGVFNHCGSFNKWMDRERIYEGQPGYPKGAYVSEHSPYREYFSFAEDGHWPYNEKYEGWWDLDTLPKLNYEGSQRLQEEILHIGRKWVLPPFCADGWRLDVAADLGHSEAFNHHFWQRFRDEVKKAAPEAVILAEHYGDPEPWLRGKEWDTVMNYDAFMDPVSWFLTGMEKHSDSFREDLYGNAQAFADAMRSSMAAFPMPSLLTAMNELDNHDHSRFLTRTNQRVGRAATAGPEAADTGTDKAVLRMAVVLQMTWPGAPTVYYVDEAGVCGFTDPDSRRTYPWGHEDTELLRFYKAAIALHRRCDVLRTGSVRILHLDGHVLGYARFDARQQVFVFLNARKESYALEAAVWPAGLSRTEECVLRQIFADGRDGWSEEPVLQTVRKGILRMELPPQSAVVLTSEGPDSGSGPK